MSASNQKFRNPRPGITNIQRNLDRGMVLQRQGLLLEAIEIFENILKKDPKNYLCRLQLGLTYLLNDNPLTASKILHLLHEERPDDLDVLRLTANAYTKLGQFGLATRFLKRVININPQDFEAWLDLTSVAAANQQNTESLYYATQAISIKPTDARAHLNLGGALSSAGRLDDALYCFETVLKLHPDNIAALSNCALIFDKRGNADEALKYLNSCTKLVAPGSQQEHELFYKMSYPLLFKGDLAQGWAMYEYGFKPNNLLSRGPKRKFSVPKWEGQPIYGKKLLVWREQGLGDELMFFHTLPEVFNLCDDVIIECESRLVTLFQRSFPNCLVRAQEFSTLTGMSLNSDFDYHIAIGSLLHLFRSEISHFSRNKPYLIPSPTLLIDFSARLKNFKPKKLVGICWRSGFVSAERNIHYTSLSSWKSIFDIPNTIFINLQYGDCDAEIVDAQQTFGIEIINFPDLDLRNDIEGVAALISNLDCVVSVGTAVAQITGALGVPLNLLVSRDWVLLGQSQYPWFKNTEIFVSDVLQSVEPLIPQVAKQLNKWLIS